jgi:MYXO-CTERM domain-containing protein
MKQSSSLGFIVACALTTSVATISMTSPASAQVNTPRTTTERTYENNNDNDNSGLWGLAGLTGLLGLLGKRRQDDNRSTTREDEAVYRDPSRR